MLVKLPPFWPDAPAVWFTSVELQFDIRGIASQKDRFCLAAAALDKDALKRVMHVITNPDPENPYDALKQALVVSHQLNDYERVELVIKMPPLGDRKPTQLAADMMEACPATEKKSKFLVSLFLQRLPNEVRIHLATEDMTDLALLAKKADQLMSYHRRQAHEVVAAIEAPPSDDESETVAAIRFSKKQHGDKQKNKTFYKKATATNADTDGNGPKLCYFHRKFGKKARTCQEPCAWTEN